MKSQCLILAASLIIPQALALMSPVESLTGSAAAASPMPISEMKNVALRRPCVPAPLCSALVDDNEGTAVTLEDPHSPAASVATGGSMRAPKTLPSARVFSFFLGQREFVSNVVVLCSAIHVLQHGQPLRGTIIVTIWSDRNNITSQSGTIKKHQHEIQLAETDALSTISFKFGAPAERVAIQWQQASDEMGTAALRLNEVRVLATDLAGGDSGDSLPVVSGKFDEVVEADAIPNLNPSIAPADIAKTKARLRNRNKQNNSLTTGDGDNLTIIDSGMLTSHDGAEPELDRVVPRWTAGDPLYRSLVDNISMQLDLAPRRSLQAESDAMTDFARFASAWAEDMLEDSSAQRSKPASKWAKQLTTSTPAAMMAPDAKTVAGYSDVMDLPKFVKEVVEGSAKFGHRESEFLRGQSRRKALGYLPHIIAALAALAVIATFLAPRSFLSALCLRCGKHAGYQRLEVEDPEAPDIVGDRVIFDSHAHWQQKIVSFQLSLLQSFGISLSQQADSTQQSLVNREAFESLRASRRSHLLEGSPCVTESEPEGELEPLMASEERPASGQVLPAPVMLGMPESSPSAPRSGQPSDHTSRRVVMLYSSPLCYKTQAQRPRPLPQLPFEREWSVMVRARDQANAVLRHADGRNGSSSRRHCAALLEAQPLTAAALQRFVSPSPDMNHGVPSVLHLSAHGIQDCLVAENGKTTAHFLSCSVLRDILGTCSPDKVPATRLVVLNACSLQRIGDEFVHGGIPHVICSSAELRDSASHVFLSALYSSLFQGSGVKCAFDAALVALRSDSEASVRSAAESFHLLPEQAPHDEVLFWPLSPLALHGSTSASLLCRPALKAVLEPATFFRHDSSASTCTSNHSASLDDDAGVATLDRALAGGNDFLMLDHGDSSTDGIEESCGSEGHADTSSNSGSASRDCGASSDSDSSNALEHAEPANAPPGSPSELEPAIVSRWSRIGAGRQQLRQSTSSTLAKARSFGSKLGCAKRPVRQQVMAPRKNAHRRCEIGSEMTLSPFGRSVPPVPDDFMGRSVDVWAVLQHLCERRAVVVCGGASTAYGIGKSAVMDAVHRAFAFQMGGACIAVQMRALTDADVASAASALGWISRLKNKVQSAIDDYEAMCRQAGIATSRSTAASLAAKSRMPMSCLRAGVLGGGNLRRRKRPGSISHGFHPLSDPIAADPALEELVSLMSVLSDVCDDLRRECPGLLPPWGGSNSGVRILLLLDECDHLIQQRHFQDAIADVLYRCSSFGIVLSTQQQMVQTGGGWFKAVHHPVGPLAAQDAARLFMRRAHRPIYWDELVDSSATADESSSSDRCSEDSSTASRRTGDSTSPHQGRIAVTISRDNEAEVLERIAAQPIIAAQHGNPRRIIEIASKVSFSLRSLSELPRNTSVEASSFV